MEKSKKAAAGRYCPKRPGYCWANLPREDQAVKAAQSKSGGRAARNKEEFKFKKEKMLHVSLNEKIITLYIPLRRNLFFSKDWLRPILLQV